MGKPWIQSQRFGFKFQLCCVLINCVPTLVRLFHIFNISFFTYKQETIPKHRITMVMK